MEMQNMGWKGPVTRIAMSLAVAVVTSFYRMAKARLVFYRLKKQGMPMPPWGPFLGNIPALATLNKRVPNDARQAESFVLLSSGLKSCFYVDVWPFGFSILVITSPELAMQTCQTHDLGKPDVLSPFIAPMAGGSSFFFDSNGTEWNRSRELFPHAFSIKASMEHVPQIIEEAEAYVDILREHDAKITLVMTVREFDLHDQYAELDHLHPPHGPNTMFGERAYLIQKGSGHPAQGFPCRVARRESAEDAYAV